MIQATCPGCGQPRQLGPETRVGDVVTCEFCAETVFRLTPQDGGYALQEVPQASCPRCDARVWLPDAVRPGDPFQHCGQTFVVTYAYGAYALEPGAEENEQGGAAR